jgi:hypothetical protein
MEKLIVLACLVGFVGDATLQIAVNNGMGGPTGWGLKDYFKLHGSTESMFIAGGMMAFFYGVFVIFKIPFTFINLAVYGIVLDYLFRTFMIFPSLKGYYEQLNYFWSAVWGAIPLCLPFLINFK